jgi:hypothetical protein
MNGVRYILFDSARMEVEIVTAKEMNKNFFSLFNGIFDEKSLSNIAPYIFAFPSDTPLSEWYFEKGWGDSWGVLVYSQEDMKYLHKHFRKFLMVKTEDGEELYFRFYDPRVLRIFLPTCDQQQLKEFFVPVDYFICEDEDPGYGLIFSLEERSLETKKVTKEEVMRFDPGQRKRRFSFF